MYTYTAGATGLDASMPPWVQEGGHKEWVKRLKDPAIRARVKREMITPTDEWENLYLAAGSAKNVLLVGFKQDSLKYLTGKTLAEVAALRGKPPKEEERVISLQEAIRRLTTLPATNLGIRKRGALRVGYFVDVVVFDPDSIADHATFDKPHQYATGMKHVFVNGVQVLSDSEHTGATPGRVVRGTWLEAGSKRLNIT